MDSSGTATIERPANAAPGHSERLADEQSLLRRYAEAPTPALKEELAARFMPLARSLAARYAGRAEPFDDLLQVASIGLVQAIHRFDPDRGAAFSTFAVPTILGELKRHFRDRGWSIRVPRQIQERILKVERAMAQLPGRLGRAPTVADIAERIGAEEEEVLEAMHAAQGHHAISLDVGPPGGDGEESPALKERIGGEDPSYDVVEYGAAIEPALRGVCERDRRILHLRFVEDLTQREIADQVGISQMHVSRTLQTLLKRLRERAGEEQVAA